MQILIIGGGNMGMTYAQSFLRAHITQPADMMILEKNQKKAVELAKQGIGTVYGRAEECLHLADIIILAVKPQDSGLLFESIKPLVDDQQLWLSIMAGIRMEAMSKALGSLKIIRAMPNLPAQVGFGMTAYTAMPAVTRVELVMVHNLLSTTGKTLYVENEKAIDAATAISGSGPAYVFYFMDAMMQAAHKMGFSQSESELLVSQTFHGAIDLFQKKDFSCREWIAKVSSKGGTTEAAMRTFYDKEVHEDIISGAQAALERAEELGKIG